MSRLKGGAFSSSEGDINYERLYVQFVACGIRIEREMDLHMATLAFRYASLPTMRLLHRSTSGADFQL